MLFLRSTKQSKWRQQAWLYSVVFNGRISVLLVFLLLGSILVQPVTQAFAEAPEEPVEALPVADDVRQQEEPPVVPEEQAPEQAAPDVPQKETTDADNQSTDVTDEEQPPAAEDDGASESPSGDSGDSGSASDDGTGSSANNDEELEDNEIVIAEQETKRVRTKDGEILKIESLVTEENYYQFNKKSCIEVGAGNFHCTSKSDEITDTDSVVYAERDEGGDMEIFLKTSRGSLKQLTDNDVDDLAPHYDAGAMKVVWHRLKDGRHQIIMYDILEEEEVQLTFSKTNNMEPKVSNAGIVWQAWDENDWEIMFFDGTYTEQITDNDIQDVAPVIQDKYILWNVLGGDEQQARVYSLETKETVSIEGHEGGSIVNPRFVLVYDTRYGNGDIVTQTFDPSTGLSQPVAATPAPLPVEIPESDPTGEIRALIQGKAQKDDEEYHDLSTGTTSDDGAASTTIANPGTLDLGAAPADISTTQAGLETDFILTEYDLVIPEHALRDAMTEEGDLQIESAQ